MGNSLTFWKYWGKVLLKSFMGAYGFVRAVMFIALIVLPIIFNQYPEWGGIWLTLSWALPAGIFLILFIPKIMQESHLFYKNSIDVLNGLYNQKVAELEELTTKRLVLKCEKTGEISGNNIWHHLVVKNPTAVAIKGCYGRLVSFTKLNGEAVVPDTVRYTWTAHRGGKRTSLSDIGPDSWDVLDIFVATTNNNTLSTPVLDALKHDYNFLFPLPCGIYHVDIQVGSEVEDFPPTHIELEVEYGGGFNLKVKKI